MKKSYVLVKYGTRVDKTTFKSASVEEYDTEKGFVPEEDKEVENAYTIKYEYHFPSDEDKCRETVSKINEEAKADDIYGDEKMTRFNAGERNYEIVYSYYSRIKSVFLLGPEETKINGDVCYPIVSSVVFDVDTGEELVDRNYKDALRLIRIHDEIVSVMRNRKNG